MIADAGYDSDPLRHRSQKRGIELIVPYRKNNKARRMKVDANCGAIDPPGSWGGPMFDSDDSVACWFVMNIYFAPIAPSSISSLVPGQKANGRPQAHEDRLIASAEF